MSKDGKTILDATREWVGSFNAVPRGMIERLVQCDPDEWTEKTILTEEEEEYYEDYLPMWGTMWSFDDSADNWWLEDGDGIEAMSKCGFRIYEHEEFGFFFGIDGAGYNFYEAHWIPLYKARGLQWHDPSAEKGQA